MRVDIDASVFEEEPEWCVPLFWFAYVGRHRVLPSASADEAYQRWHKRLASAGLQRIVALAHDSSFSASVSEPAHHRVVVSTIAGPATCSPSEAWQLLQRPYRVLVEDAFNDRAFVLRMCPPEERAWLLNRLRSEWLEFDHGGGITNMPRRVRELAAHSYVALASCLFDSDSDLPGELSDQAVALQSACAADQIHHHVLERRAMENYLPRSALERWVGHADRVPMQRARRALVKALWAAPERRNVNIKKHLKDRDVGKLYANEEAMNDHDIASEGGPAELGPFIREIIRRAR